jgi:hypothetical protein
MWDLLLKLIEQLNSSVFVLIAILILAAIGLFKIGRWTEIFKNHEDKITKVENLAEKVLVMGTKVDLIYENTLGSKRVVAAMSPITLTDIGKDIAEKIKADTILERCIPQLVKEVELEKPNNAYDIQMISMKVAKERMISCLNENELTTVKQEAYNRGLLVEDIMSVFGVLLRNHMLNKKGIPISDVDKHTPAKN